MKLYDQLTPAGIKRRLRKVAELSIEQYDLDIVTIDFLEEATNIFFKIVDRDGTPYALKIFLEASSTIDDNIAEVFFLRHIRAHTDIAVPSVLSARDGQDVLFIESKYTPTAKRVAIYTWLEGKDLDGKENEKRFNQLGRIAAQLHNATENIALPAHLRPKKWDKVFYYNGEVPVYKEEKYQSFLTERFHRIMDGVIPYLNDQLAALYDGQPPQLIHADLNPWNVKLHGDDMRLLDFEEAMYGLPVHDIAIMLFYYRHDDKFNYKEVLDQFMSGYASVRPAPGFSEFDLEMLMIARRVNFMNYILLLEDKPTKYLNMCMDRVEAFLEQFDIQI